MGSTYHVQTYEGTHARRIARAATHPGPASPPFSHIWYVLHQLFHLLPARLNTLIVLLTFTCQVWAFKYIFGSVLVFHTFLLSDIFDHFYHRSRRIIGGGCIYDFLSIATYAWGQSPLSTWSTVCCWFDQAPDTSLSSAILRKIIKFQLYSIQHTPDCIALVGSFQLLHKANQLYKLSSVPILRLLPISDW